MTVSLAALAQPYRGLPRIAWLIALGESFCRGANAAMGFLALYLAMKFNSSAQEIGWLISLIGVATLLGSFLGGWLADLFSPRMSLICCQVILSIFYLLIPFLPSYFLLTPIVFLTGLFTFCTRPILGVVAVDLPQVELLPRSNALRRAGINLGSALGTSLSGLLMGFWPDSIFFLAGLISLIAAFVFLFVIPKATQKHHDNKPRQKTAIINYLLLLRDINFTLLLMASALMGFIFLQELSNYKLYLAEAYHLDTAMIGYISAANGFIIVLIELPLIHFLRKNSPVLLCLLGGIFYGIGFGMLPLQDHVLWAWLSVVIWTLGEILSAPTGMAIAQEQAAKSSSPGLYMGLFTASMAAPGIIAPSLGGWFYVQNGGVLLWQICFACGIFAALCLWLIYRRSKLRA